MTRCFTRRKVFQFDGTDWFEIWQRTMPENAADAAGEPRETDFAGADSDAKNDASGGFSPHSTTTSPGGSGNRKRPASGSLSEPEEAPARRTSPGDGAPLKQVLAAVYRLAASVSRQHAERVLQIITDLVVSHES